MKYRKVIAVFFASLLVPSCGIEENYYLPQVPQNRITRTNNTEAVIILPSLNQYNYAQNYIIYYKIYISGEDSIADIQTSSERSNISSDLASDYSAINPYADPVSQSQSNVSTILKNRNYFELELDGADIKNSLPLSGGSVRIFFPTSAGEYPTLSYNDGQGIRFRRSRQLISPQPVGDPYFRNTNDLSNPENSNSNINADVASRSGSTGFAYASMYIVAVGLTNDFKQIFSKPTHISIFKLPNV
ncbi:MAG: hypothetical protein LBQ82_02920 [Treponema sp.]|jgi:hypothetical protein|nr:hypothetical protein [Treponema sp.]